MTTNKYRLFLVCVMVIFVFSFLPYHGGNTASAEASPPSITSIDPLMRQAGTAGFQLVVRGTGFQSSAVVRWNGEDLSTSRISTIELRAAVPAEKVVNYGIYSITVVNPDDQVSNAFEFKVYTFADVTPAYPLWSYVETFYEHKITTGCGTNPLRYCPNRNVTRGEMAVFLLRANNAYRVPAYAPDPILEVQGIFADVPVPGKEFMKPWIEEYYEQGFTTGCGVNSTGKLLFCPERNVTRAEMAVFALRALYGKTHVPPAASGTFIDVPVPGKEWMEPWIEEFYSLGITTGCGGSIPGTDLKYCPERNVTRGEMATFLSRSFINTNPLTGSGRLDGFGVPDDFFSDVHIRKAFSYSFDWDKLIEDVYGGKAVQSLQLPMPGMIGYDPDVDHYSYDLDMAETEFKLADLDYDGIPAGDETDGSDVWNLGFSVSIAYNEGNGVRQAIAEILAENLALVNPKFQAESYGLPWSEYLAAQRAGQLPALTAGWLEDVHDPYNWYMPYTRGTYANRQRMPEDLKQQFELLVNAALAEPDPALRASIYHQLNQLYYDQVPGIPMVLTEGHSYEQRWITGRLKNPILSGLYFYPISKPGDPTDPTSVVYAVNGGPDTLDPALAYDTTSSQVIQNIYESLIFFEGEKLDSYVPQLATVVPTTANGGISADGRTYTFHIRSGVTFHNGNPLTASDVAYSFQRGILQGGYSSPQLLLAEPLLGVGNDDITMIVDGGASADDRAALKANDPADLVAACELVKSRIVADNAAATVTFTLPEPWSLFLATLATTYGSVMDKEWTVANGGWNGSCDTWTDYYAMTSAEDPITPKANGTGPFKLSYWSIGDELLLVRNSSYWRTTPAYTDGPSGVPVLTSVLYDEVYEVNDRYAMLADGSADFAVMTTIADDLVGETCTWDESSDDYGTCVVNDAAKPLRLYDGRPTVVSQDVLLYTFDIQ